MLSVVLAALGSLDPENLLESFGALGLFLIIFAESGLLVGFFLPGDSLLFTAGLLSSQDKLAGAADPAGRRASPPRSSATRSGTCSGAGSARRCSSAPDSRIFKQEYVEKAQNYFEEHGSKTIVLARFVPVVRTFAPIVAGVGRMHYRTFVFYNVIGGFLWAVGITTLGYILGETVPVDRQVPAAGDRGDHRPVGHPGAAGGPQGPAASRRRPAADADARARARPGRAGRRRELTS